MTDISGIQQAVQKIAEQTVQDQGKSGTLDKGVASAEDVQKLQAALNQPPADANANGLQQAQGVEKVGAVQPSAESSPGAKILDHMNGMRTGLQEALNGLQGSLAKPDMSPAELVKVQLKLQQVTMQQELTGKVVSKSEQNIDQLLKGQ